MREHALSQAKMVPQINKQQPAMVPLGVNPAGKPGRGANIGGPQSGTIMGAVGMSNNFHERERNDTPFPVKPPDV
jgi:hypothetical protein